MSLKKTIIKDIFGSEVIIENAYHRIHSVEGSKNRLTIMLITFTEDQSKEIETNFYDFVPSQEEDAPRWDKQGYNYLKTLEEFDGAIDC